jgi:predicted nuclease of predicted toxin-antitoxin system
LKARGYSSSSVHSENISGITDKELLKICYENHFILITQDKDFTNIQAYPTKKHKGIIVLRLSSQGINIIIEAFENLTNKMNLANSKNNLIIVEKEHIRIRK